MLDRRVLKNLIEIHDLPTLPQVIHEVLAAVQDENSSARDITALLERDHAISARVLRLANSAFYGIRHRVSSIRQAVVMLGYDAVTEIALASSVFSSFAEKRQFALDPEEFWMHSFGAAKGAHMLCERFGPHDERESAFTAALLHGIGKYVLALILKGEYARLVQRARAEQRRLVDIERPLLGMTHDAIGAWLANKWRFPPLALNVIANQYAGPEEVVALGRAAAMAVLAKGLARASGFGDAGDYDLHNVDVRLVTALALSRTDITEVQRELKALRPEVRAFVSDQPEKGGGG